MIVSDIHSNYNFKAMFGISDGGVLYYKLKNCNFSWKHTIDGDGNMSKPWCPKTTRALIKRELYKMADTTASGNSFRFLLTSADSHPSFSTKNKLQVRYIAVINKYAWFYFYLCLMTRKLRPWLLHLYKQCSRASAIMCLWPRRERNVNPTTLVTKQR